MKKVSIIIPLYNSAQLIKQTIDSCINQSYDNIEIIVVENRSTDNSLEEASKLESNKIKVFSITATTASAARNYGLSKANGDYIQYLDADDILSPNKIEEQLKLLQNQPDGFVASCGWGKFKTDITEAVFIEQPVWKIKSQVEWLTTSWNGGGMMQTACWLIPRKVIEKAGVWDERLTLHDDGEFMCRVLLASEGNIFCEDAKVYYRVLSNSLSKTYNRKAVESALKVYQSYKTEILKIENSAKTRKALALNFSQFLYQFYSAHSDLANNAINEIKELDIEKIPVVGGKYFRALASLVGFINTLKLKSFFYK